MNRGGGGGTLTGGSWNGVLRSIGHEEERDPLWTEGEEGFVVEDWLEVGIGSGVGTVG